MSKDKSAKTIQSQSSSSKSNSSFASSTKSNKYLDESKKSFSQDEEKKTDPISASKSPFKSSTPVAQAKISIKTSESSVSMKNMEERHNPQGHEQVASEIKSNKAKSPVFMTEVETKLKQIPESFTEEYSIKSEKPHSKNTPKISSPPKNLAQNYNEKDVEMIPIEHQYRDDFTEDQKEYINQVLEDKLSLQKERLLGCFQNLQIEMIRQF
jgi:hypothetical protein